MGTNLGPSPGDPFRFETSSLPAALKRYYEYVLLIIPVVAPLVSEGYSSTDGSTFLSETAFFIMFMALPILMCLSIITIKYRKYDARAALSRYAAVGLCLPPLFVCCVMIATFVSWRKDDGAIGWFMLMAVPAAIAFSLVTATVGMAMRLMFRGVQWCILMAQSKNE